MSCLNLALLLGEKVERASATLPQTSTDTLFTISGGRVVITSLFGTVTVATGSVNLEVKVDPVVGSTTTLKSDGLSSESPGYVTGQAGFQAGWSSNTAVVPTCQPIIVPEGDIFAQTNGSVVGEMKWTLTYVALDEGASITSV